MACLVSMMLRALQLHYDTLIRALTGDGWYKTTGTNILSMEESQRMNIVFLQSLRVVDRIVTLFLNVPVCIGFPPLSVVDSSQGTDQTIRYRILKRKFNLTLAFEMTWSGINLWNQSRTASLSALSLQSYMNKYKSHAVCTGIAGGADFWSDKTARYSTKPLHPAINLRR